ncbi:helix-turn-helix transcriptional regulator [Mucilaginibacter mali]|uniref:Helix-turn-helix transcriptional regulator n=1 Tax=Mucilaginibacter mali TaxID=2740462 RepID=A0A7D4PWH0_9SPHI|nr:helix-turn-helix transcriptional regulator [Mucilaginibacter mali]QKJ32448.1 helix-turn-helix transcriptional regulator [Mucilaginibacter mali]
MARQDAGYEQKRIAELLGLTAISLCNWENERAMPSGTNLIKLCVLYGRSPRELYPEYYQQIEGEIASLWQPDGACQYNPIPPQCL